MGGGKGQNSNMSYLIHYTEEADVVTSKRSGILLDAIENALAEFASAMPLKAARSEKPVKMIEVVKK
jgi:hypothetical protein